MVLVHGTNTGPWTLERFFEHFEAKGFRCHAPSLPHHEGLSSPEAAARLTGVSIADSVAAVGAVVDGLADEPIIGGHSSGGVIAQLLAAQQETRAIVLLNGSVISEVLPTTPEELELGKLSMPAGRFWETTLLPDFPTMARFGLNRLEPAMQRQVFDRLGPELGQ